MVKFLIEQMERELMIQTIRGYGLLVDGNEADDELKALLDSYILALKGDFADLQDNNVLQLLRALGERPGPVLASTRSIYERKLRRKLGVPVETAETVTDSPDDSSFMSLDNTYSPYRRRTIGPRQPLRRSMELRSGLETEHVGMSLKQQICLSLAVAIGLLFLFIYLEEKPSRIDFSQK
ncbi:hypothetical protein ACOME3_001112 [Neoechinorhynchus agilis]